MRLERILRDGALLILALAGSNARASAPDPLFDSFREPPARLRPFVRWWWNGARVNEAEAVRQLDVMRAAGIGGFEINTIAMPEYVPSESLAPYPEKAWLSPQWCRVVDAVARAARERGLTADIIVGSGWPFGGRFVPPAEQTKRVRVAKRRLDGPVSFDARVAELVSVGSASRERDEVNVPPRVVFVRLVRAGATDFEAGSELAQHAVDGDRVRLRVPAGPHELRIGLLETGFTHVKLGAPGADGPVIDHWNAAAVRRYLDHMSGGLAPALGGRLGEAQGGPLRAAFVDSLELDRANWTDDLAAEFARRRGYEFAPYLPFVLDPDAARGDTPAATIVRRARYDFDRTLVELFRERFLQTYVAWAHDNGLLARMQAYGRETHPLEGSLLPDLPEGESWLWSGHDRIVVSPSVVNKYVSSGAHLAGHAPVSFEAMTNAVPVFRELLEDFKLGMDGSALAGVHHPVLHGFNYSPREAGFPGWVRFGSWLNEQNPWWPHVRRFTDYAARLTTVLAGSEFQASVALVGPRADEWARDGLLYQPFPEVSRPWYHYHLWQALQQAGFGTDYLSESILREARAADGRIRYGTRSYDTLLLMEPESLEPETAEALVRAADAGVRVVFVGRAPERAPGLKDAAAKDRRVREAIGRLLQPAHAGAALVEAPSLAGALDGDVTRGALPEHARRSLLQWVLATARQLGLVPDVRVEAPSVDVSLVHHRSGEREIFFLANASRTAAAELAARFPTGDRQPWLWDPETGERAVFAATEPSRLALHLEPLQSLLLVFEPAATAAGGTATGSALPPRRGKDALPVVTSWDVELRPATGPAFRRTFPQLFDLSLAAGDPAVAAFGGTLLYRTEFDWRDASLTLLSLGTVHGTSSVRLNGRNLGTRWYGSHRYDVGGILVAGRNVIEVEVTTTLGNLMRSRENDAATRRWAWWFPPIPSGLVGPVQLMKPRDEPPAVTR